MGDGIQKKYALIINGDTEARHVQNVELSIQALRSEDRTYDISVASTARPTKPADHFESADEAGLGRLIAGLKNKMDGDDLLIVYVTGHDDDSTKKECFMLQDKSCFPLTRLAKELSKVKYGRRGVIMDQCQSGGALPLFANKKTSVITGGSPNEVVSCELFSPYFWSTNVPDRDKNNIITLDERYAHAVLTGKTPSLTQYYSPSAPISLSGAVDEKLPFEPRVIEVNTGVELDGQLNKLAPGQLALVQFSADWCDKCKAYSPKFDALAKKYKGQFLMIRAEGIKGSEKDWKKYNNSEALPALAFIDERGTVTIVGTGIDPGDPMDKLVMASINDVEEQLKIYSAELKSKDPEKQAKAIIGLGNMGKHAAPRVPELTQFLSHNETKMRKLGINALANIGKEAESAASKLAKSLSDPEFHMRKAAVEAIGSIAADGGDVNQAVPHLLALVRRDQFKEISHVFFRKADVSSKSEADFHAARISASYFYRTISWAFTRIGEHNEAALLQLFEILEDPQTPPYIVSGILSYPYVNGIKALGDKGTLWVPTLVKFLDSEYRSFLFFSSKILKDIAVKSPQTALTLARIAKDKKAKIQARFDVFFDWHEEYPEPIVEAAKKVVQDETDDIRIRKVAAEVLKNVKVPVEWSDLESERRFEFVLNLLNREGLDPESIWPQKSSDPKFKPEIKPEIKPKIKPKPIRRRSKERPSIRPFVVPISVGARYLSLKMDEKESSPLVVNIGIGGGIVSRSEPTGFVGGGGISAELSVLGSLEDPDASGEMVTDDLYVVDVAAWGQLGWNTGPLDLTLEPLIGISHAIAGNAEQTGLLIGGNAGLSFFGGGLSVIAQGRGMPSHGGYSVGGALRCDLPSLIQDID